MSSLFSIVYGQDIQNNNYYTLLGTIVNGDDNTPLIGANLVSSRNIGTKTNSLGEFSIHVYAGDTLKITYTGFKKIKYVIPFKKKGQFLTKFKMYKDSVSLSEVEIFPWPSYNDFKKAFITLDKQDEQIGIKGVKMYQDRNVAPYKVQFSTLFSHPLTFIYDKLFDKKAKMRRRLDRRREIIKNSQKSSK